MTRHTAQILVVAACAACAAASAATGGEIVIVEARAAARDEVAGALEQKLTVSERAGLPSPGDFASFRVLGARVVPEVTAGQRLGRGNPRGTWVVRAAHGRLLAVEVELTPKRSNTGYEGHLRIESSRLGLVAPSGAFSPAVGVAWKREAYRIEDPIQLERRADGTWPSCARTLYFVVPEGLKEFALTYLQAPVAKGTVGE